MFQSIIYTNNRYDDWTGKTNHIFRLIDSDWEARPTAGKLDGYGGLHYGRCRDTFAAVVAKEYAARGLGVAKNLALFYAWYWSKNRNELRSIGSFIIDDASYIDRFDRLIKYSTNYLPCVCRQIDILKYRHKFPTL